MMVEASLVNLAELVVLVVGVVIALQQLNDIKQTRELELETRQAQLFMQIYDRWASKEMTQMEWGFLEWEWDDWDDYKRKYFSNLENRTVRTVLGKYYEGIGVLVKRGLIDPTFVDDLMSSSIMLYWEKYSPVIEEWRDLTGYPQLGEYSEYLYNQIKAIVEKQHPELRS